MKLHPEWAEEQYLLAEPYLNILSEEPRKVSTDRVKQFEDTIKTLKMEKNGLEEKIQRLEAQLNAPPTQQDQTLQNIANLLTDPETMKKFKEFLKRLAQD